MTLVRQLVFARTRSVRIGMKAHAPVPMERPIEYIAIKSDRLKTLDCPVSLRGLSNPTELPATTK